MKVIAEKIKRFVRIVMSIGVFIALLVFSNIAMHFINGLPFFKSSDPSEKFVQRAVSLDGKITCQARKDFVIHTMNPCKDFVAPSEVSVGAKFTANGKERVIGVIQANFANEDIPDYGDGPIKKGEWWCIAGETESDLDLDSGSDHIGSTLFLTIMKCKPLL